MVSNSSFYSSILLSILISFLPSSLGKASNDIERVDIAPINSELIKEANPVPGTMAFGSALDVLSNTTNPNVDQAANTLLNGFDISAISSNARFIALAPSGNAGGSDAIGNGSDAVLLFTGDALGTFTSGTLSSDDATEFGLTGFQFAYERSPGQGTATLDFTFSAKRDGVEVGTLVLTSPGHNVAISVDFTSPTSGSFANIDEIIIKPASQLNGGWAIDDMVIVTAMASDATPPIFDVAPATSSVTASGFTVGASIDEGGDIYYVVLADGATAPTSANVIAGQANGGGAAIKSGSGTSLSDPFTLSSAVTGLAAGTAYDVYVVARDDEGTPNVQASATKVDVNTLAPSSLQVAATVFLEGAWNGTNAMNTTLEDADLVSASAPYNGTNSHAGSESVASAAAVPDGAVDWVLLELREAGSAATATNATRKGSAAGFLMSDGTIKATDGSSNLTVNLSGNTGTDYYVVIYHRNHLPIMSASAIAGSSGTLTIDFTTNSANTYQTTTALVSLAGSKFGMPAGDSNGDGNINTTDLGTWRTNNGAVYSYSGSGLVDFNLDGEINAVDRNDFQQKNTSKTRQVPSI